jgi:hypothetical protein
MKIYAIFATNHDLAMDDARCGQFENWCPIGVYRTREAAEAAICEEINEARAEIREDLIDDDSVLDGYEDVKPGSLDWSGDETSWTYYDKPQDLYYVMSEHELAD